MYLQKCPLREIKGKKKLKSNPGKKKPFTGNPAVDCTVVVDQIPIESRKPESITPTGRSNNRVEVLIFLSKFDRFPSLCF